LFEEQGKAGESPRVHSVHLGYGVTNDVNLVGVVTPHIDSDRLNGGDVYLCGPPPMVDAVRAWLSEHSVTPVNIYYERFAPSGSFTGLVRG
jgi:NAD(P)H-flavin reductase